jgi:ATP-dependent helicase/nuclease subunit A
MIRQYTEAQCKAIDTTGRHLCVDAGAGSGKTMVLIERILRLLESRKAGLDEIVAITFTDRAAGEMKERLRREAHRRAPRDDAQKMTFWREIERRADSARISTIHAFCMALLKEQALALGQDPEFAIINDAEGHLLRHETAEAVLHAALEAEDAAAIRLAVEFGAKAVTEEVAKLLKQRGTMERAILAAPHDDPAALRAHWRATVAAWSVEQLEAAEPEIARIQRELRALDGCCTKPGDKREAMRGELLAIVEALLRARSVADCAEAYDRLSARRAEGRFNKSWTSQDAFNQIKDCRDDLRDQLKFLTAAGADPGAEDAAAQLTCDVAALYQQAAAAYQQEKRQRAAMEFDDLILDTLHILRTRDDIRRGVAAGIKFLLIDEFQDTDHLQLELALLLADSAPGPELFFVGDAKQSIYYFRGAEVEVFNEAQRIGAPPITLDRNFRTTPNVLEFVNHFFTQTALLHRVEQPYHPMVPHRPAADGPCVELMLSPGRDDEKVRVREARQIEAATIARRIHAMCNGPEPVCVADPDTAAPRPARYGDVAMLFRATSDLYLYEQALQALGIPYYVVAGSGFYQRQEILDMLNLLHVVIDPCDTYALFGFLRSPVAGISDETLLHLQWQGGFAKAFACAGYEGPQKEAFEAAQALVADLRAHCELPLPVFLRRVLERSAYEAILLGQHLGSQKAANIRKMMDLAHNFGRTRSASLRAFVHYMDRMASVELPEGEAAMLPEAGNAVILMTIHKAKGLEFPIVFVPDLGRGRAQSSSAIAAAHPRLGLCVRPYGDEGQLETIAYHRIIQDDHTAQDEAEHARILYVALTRARDWLVLSTGPDRCAKGSWMESIAKVLQPDGRPEGAPIPGPGGRWQWLLWRGLDNAAAVAPSSVPRAAVDTARLLRQIASIDTLPAARRVFGVSEVLEILCPKTHDDAGTEGAPPRHAMLRGEVVHRFFECWDFATDPGQLIARVVDELRVPSRLRDTFANDLRQIAAGVRAHAISGQLALTARAMRERPFLLRVGDALVRGEIDVLLPDGAVVDYKTGARRPELEARYLWQLRLYAAAVDALNGAVADEASLFYVDTGEAVTIDVSRPFRAEALETAAAAIMRLQSGIAPHPAV